MSIITKASAKNYFVTGAYPTQGNFADTIDSYLGLGETLKQTVSGPVMFVSKVSADGGINTSIVSAATVNATTVQTTNFQSTNFQATTISATNVNATTVSAASVYASTFVVSGASITGVKGTTAIVASVSGAVTNGHFAKWDPTGNLVDGGATSTSNVYQNSPANPSSTTSTSNVMAGLAGAITPNRTGNILIVITGQLQNVSSNVTVNVQGFYGTGTAPSNGAAQTGTSFGSLMNPIAANSGAKNQTFICSGIISGLTLNTAIWIDVAFAANNSGTASLSQISISAVEV